MSEAPEPRPPAPPPRVARARLELLAVAAITAVLLAAVFGPLLLDPGASGKYDVYRAFGPWSYFLDRSIQGGDYPEWNPLTLGGAPFAANPQCWALYPPNVLRALSNVHPTPLSTLGGLAVLALMHVWLLGFGTYRLARAHGLSPAAAAVALLGACLNALVVRRVAELHFVFTLAWLPFILIHARGFVRAGSPRERLHEAAWLALYTALMVLGGFPQLYPYIAAGVLAYALTERLTDPRLHDAAAAEPRAARTRLLGSLVQRDVAYAVPAVALMLALAACLLLPAAEFAGFSARVTSAAHEADGHLPAEWTLGYAWRAVAVYSGQRYEPETLRGAGIGVLALAAAGILGGVRRRTAGLFVAFYVYIDLLVGKPMPIASALAIASPFQMVSATRAADVGLVFLALLAGSGVDALRERAVWRRLLAAAAALSVGGAALYALHRQLELGRVWLQPSLWAMLAPAALLAVALAVAFTSRSALRWLSALPAALALLVACELFAWNGPYARELIVHRNFQREWLSTTDVEGKNPFWPDNRRHPDERPNFGLFTLQGLVNGYDPLHLDGVRTFLASGSRSRRYERTVRVEEILAYNARTNLLMKRAFWLVPNVVIGAQPSRRSLFPPTEVAFVAEKLAHVPARSSRDVKGRGVSREATRIAVEVPALRGLGLREGRNRARARTQWIDLPPRHAVLELVLRAGGRVLIAPHVERGDAAPFFAREELAHEVEVKSDDIRDHRVEIPLPDATRMRFELDLDWDGAAQAPELISLAVLSDAADEDAKIAIVHRSADETRVHIRELIAPRLLVFTDADYPGWHAEVDGKPARIVRTAGVFKGVEVPAGSHDVRFYFRSTRLHTGLWLSALGFVVAAALLWATRRRHSIAANPA